MNLLPVSTVDYHTAGEPFRIVSEPPLVIKGATVADKRAFAIDDPDVDGLRRLLCLEPRGHADMYGGFIVSPNDSGAHLGVLFWHKDGFSTACGHGSMALGAWAIQSGLVETNPAGVTEVRIDVPSGRVSVTVHTDGEQITALDFVNVPSYVLHRDVEVSTSRGDVVVNVAYGGALFAHLDASDVGLAVIADNYTDLIAIGREVKWLLNDTEFARHPSDPRLSGIYGTILFDDLRTDEHGNPHQRNIAVFADGEVDRSPCGSGTSSRLAVLAADGVLKDGQHLIHDSIVDTRFLAKVIQTTTESGYPAVVPEISGMAYGTGRHTFELDPSDPLGEGFVLR